jgi:(1->4)-alpha-D-glucan 1-alpha-D-glucosylmutase
MQILKELRRQEGEGREALIAQMLSHLEDGRLKLYLSFRALNFRKNFPDLFLQGDYLPLAAKGDRSENVLAFARQQENNWVLAVAARFFTQLATPGQSPIGEEVWGESILLLPPQAPVAWVDILTVKNHDADVSGKSLSLPLSRVFQHLPVAFLSVSG